MTRFWRILGIAVTIILTGFFTYAYIQLERFYYDDAACGCSSACVGFYVSKTSKEVGRILLILSSLTFIASIWRVKSLSKWWAIPALTVFVISFYGNGFMLFNKGACGQSLNKTTFFIKQDKLGDFAKQDAESINFDSLKAGRYKSKLLGFYLQGNMLTVYRIAETPLKIKTGFIFWQTDKEKMLKDFSYGLNSYRHSPKTLPEKHIELIGGQNMPMEAFMEELKMTNNWGVTKIISKKIINSSDGTTRLHLEID